MAIHEWATLAKPGEQRRALGRPRAPSQHALGGEGAGVGV